MQRKVLRRNWIVRHGLSSIMDSVFGNTAVSEPVTLPHDALISSHRRPDSICGSDMAYFVPENLEYTGLFDWKEAPESEVAYLDFDGVYTNAEYFVNGIYLGRNPSGYVPYIARVDHLLEEGENEVRVVLRTAAQPTSRWYPGTGIYREAALLSGPLLHIRPHGVRIETRTLEKEMAILHLEAELMNADRKAALSKLEICIKDPKGAPVHTRVLKAFVPAGETIRVSARIEVHDPEPWDAEHPVMYLAYLRLRSATSAVDEQTVPFGIRKLDLDSIHGLRVNGRTVKLKGGAVHHDNGVIGAVSVPDAEKRKLRILKGAGYNAVRTAHNPPSTAFLDACDEIGLYVMHEFTDVWTESKTAFDYSMYFPTHWEQDVEAVVRRDFNHPSIVLWSIGNEIHETGDPRSLIWGRRLAEKFRELDTTRYVTNGLNVMVSSLSRLKEIVEEMHELNADSDRKGDRISGGVNAVMNNINGLMAHFNHSRIPDQLIEEACDMLDVVGFNYTEERYQFDHERHPSWIFVGTETGTTNLDKNWELVERLPYVIGDFGWVAWDYLGETGIRRFEDKKSYQGNFAAPYPWISANCGDIDITGKRLPISYWRETVWGGRTGRPFIAVQRPEHYKIECYESNINWTDSIQSWTWPGFEGKGIVVEVYTDADEAELLINGVSAGRKTVGNERWKFYCSWDTVYMPGTVEVIAYRNGLEDGRASLQTAGDADLQISVDKETLKAGSDELCYVEIEMYDEAGILQSARDMIVKIETEGPIHLLGAGSACPWNEENYISSVHKTFEGRMIAVIRPGEKPGNGRILVQSENGSKKIVELHVK